MAEDSSSSVTLDSRQESEDVGISAPGVSEGQTVSSLSENIVRTFSKGYS